MNGQGGGVLPDLRFSGTLANNEWLNIVRGGSLKAYGTVGFSNELSPEDAEAIRAYVIFRGIQSQAESSNPKKP